MKFDKFPQRKFKNLPFGAHLFILGASSSMLIALNPLQEVSSTMMTLVGSEFSNLDKEALIVILKLISFGLLGLFSSLVGAASFTTLHNKIVELKVPYI